MPCSLTYSTSVLEYDSCSRTLSGALSGSFLSHSPGVFPLVRKYVQGFITPPSKTIPAPPQFSSLLEASSFPRPSFHYYDLESLIFFMCALSSFSGSARLVLKGHVHWWESCLTLMAPFHIQCATAVTTDWKWGEVTTVIIGVFYMTLWMQTHNLDMVPVFQT